MKPQEFKEESGTDELRLPLIVTAVILALDVLFSSPQALPGHNHSEPFDSLLKTLLTLLIAGTAYARPVEWGAQLLDQNRYALGLAWLILILGTPLLVIFLLPGVSPLIGLVTMLLCAIVANIVTKIVAPVNR